MSAEKPYMSIAAIDRLRPEMVKRHVSEVARSPRGFLRQYRKAGGRFSNLSPYWRRRRNNFVKRHLAQTRSNREKLWRIPGTLAKGEAPKEHLDIEFFLGILAIDGHGSITKTQAVNPDETPGSARGGHLGGR